VYVIDLYVDLEYRANGIGKALMKRANEEALSQGATDLWWGVYERNPLALKFYESLGAKHINNVHFMSIKAEALSDKST
jgi:diamine N-acetyltransferase